MGSILPEQWTTSLSLWTNYGPLTSIFTPPPECNYLTISYSTPLSITGTATSSAPTSTKPPHLVFFDPSIAPTCFPSQYPELTSEITKASTSSSRSTTSSAKLTGFFSPGRCPDGWATRTISYSYIPAEYTLAACCPSFGSVSPSDEAEIEKRELEKRRGTPPKKANPTGCFFTLPTITPTNTQAIATDTTTASYSPITALANGSLTTMAPQAWFEIGGTSSGKTVWATGLNVMWKRGDFPDIDRTADAAAALSSAATARLLHPPSTGLPLGAKIAIGTVIPVFVILATVFLCLCMQSRRRARGNSATAGTRRMFGRSSKPEGESGKTEKLTIVEQVKAERLGKASRGAAAGSGAGRGEDDIENVSNQPTMTGEQAPHRNDIPPPSYDPSSGPSSAAPTDTNDRRMWNETDLEYEQRRLAERKELLEERIRLAREEDALRARMRNEAP